MTYIARSIAWITSNHGFRPAIDFVVAQLSVTVAYQVVHAAHEQPDGFAAGLLALDPGDLIASDVLGRVALLADQLAVRELAGVVQRAHLLADLLAGVLAQEVVHHADAVLVHAGHDVLQRQLQRRQRLRLPVGPRAVAQRLTRRAARRGKARLVLEQRRAAQRLLLGGLRLSRRRALTAGRRARRGRGRRGLGLRAGGVPGGGGGAVPARRRRLPGLPGPGGPGRRRGGGVRARAVVRGAVAALAHQLVLLPVLALVLLAAVEGAAAAAAAQQVLHLPAQLAVLPVSLARARPAGPAAVVGHGGGRAGGVAAGRPGCGPSLRHAPAAPRPREGDPAPSARPLPSPSGPRRATPPAASAPHRRRG